MSNACQISYAKRYIASYNSSTWLSFLSQQEPSYNKRNRRLILVGIFSRGILCSPLHQMDPVGWTESMRS